MRIEDLRKKLDEWEAKWTSEDDTYMGKFGDQEIYVPVYEWNRPEPYASDGAFDYKGLGRDLLVYWDMTGLGIVIDHVVHKPDGSLTPL